MHIQDPLFRTSLRGLGLLLLLNLYHTIHLASASYFFPGSSSPRTQNRLIRSVDMPYLWGLRFNFTGTSQRSVNFSHICGCVESCLNYVVWRCLDIRKIVNALFKFAVFSCNRWTGVVPIGDKLADSGSTVVCCESW